MRRPTEALSAREPGAAESAYARLKSMILESALPPGAQRLETELAAELGVSRTPIREALIRLVQDGLIAVSPRHGMRVLAISVADLREIHDMLTSLEPTAAELLARRGLPAAELGPLSDACDAMEAALAAEDRRAWAAGDAAFQRALVALCGNQRLAATVTQLWEQSHRARLVAIALRPLPRGPTAEHRAVLEAIAAGDGEAARGVYRLHRLRAGAELINIIERSGLAWL